MIRCDMVRGLFVGIGFLSLLLASPPVSGTSMPTGPVFQPKLEINNIPTSIAIDGQLDDPGWRVASHITDFYEIRPGNNLAPDVETKVYVGYSSDHLYVAFLCKDDPSSVRATMCQRDQPQFDDMVTVLLDTYGNGSWAYEFMVNPYGIQKDQLWLVNGPEDVSFDVIWQSAAQRTDSGYQVEMAIPFSSLRFPSRDVHAWRVDFWRDRPRESFKQYAWAPRDRNRQCFPCQFGTVTGITEAKPGQGIELLPTFVGHRSGERLSDNDFRDHDVKGEFSLGGKYRPTSDLTLEASINPDFSQIEADASQIDVNSTTALFFPERRPYFKEGSDLFATLFNSFYTRTIADPSFTAKLVGRMPRTSFAFLSAIDENSPYVVPVGQFSLPTLNSGRSLANVFRGLHTLGGSTQVGVLLSDRRFEDDGIGSVLAGDFFITLTKSIALDGQYIATYNREMNNPAVTDGFNGLTFDKGKHTVDFDGESFWGTAFIQRARLNNEHVSIMADYNQVSPAYRTLIGYDPVNNHRSASVNASYAFLPTSGLFERIEPGTFLFRRWSWDGPLEQEYNEIGVFNRLRFAQTEIGLFYRNRAEEFARVQFDNLSSIRWYFETRPHEALSITSQGTTGKGIAYRYLEKADEFNGSVGVTVKPVDRLTVESSVQYYRAGDPEGDTAFFKGYISRTRLQLQANQALSVRLIAEYDDFSRSWTIDPLLTYRLNSFSVFYIGSAVRYADWSLTKEPPFGPTDWKLSNRQFFIKLQYLFQV